MMCVLKVTEAFTTPDRNDVKSSKKFWQRICNKYNIYFTIYNRRISPEMGGKIHIRRDIQHMKMDDESPLAFNK